MVETDTFHKKKSTITKILNEKASRKKGREQNEEESEKSRRVNLFIYLTLHLFSSKQTPALWPIWR